MMRYLFTAQISGINLTQNYADILYNAGCNDALISVVDGIMYLDFDRDASSLSEAVESAECDIVCAGGHVDYIMK